MPTYDYECDACDHKFELFQSIKDSTKKKCPECGKMKLRRLFGTGAAVMFKGSGFYTTDYRSDSYKKAANADTAPSTDKSASSDGGSSKSSDSAAAAPKSDNPTSKKKPKSPDK